MEFFDFCDNTYESTLKNSENPNSMKDFVLASLALLSLTMPCRPQTPGSLIITEYMANPEEVPNEMGEYIELYNASSSPVNLKGCIIRDGNGRCSSPAEDVWVQPGAFAVAGGSAVPYAQFYYPDASPAPVLNNVGGDEVTITCGGVLVAATSFSASQPAGTAMELVATGLHQNGITAEKDYRPATGPFFYRDAEAFDYGSPGQAGGTALPAAAVSRFNARAEGRQVSLSWSAAAGPASSHFVVEHSTDGQPFLPVGRLSCTGTPRQLREYRFQHQEPGPGLNYYRLQQVASDGAISHSEILPVEMPALRNSLQLYPIPATHTLSVEWQKTPERPIAIRVLGLQGNVASSLKLQPGERRTQLPVSSLPAGYYLIYIEDGSTARQAMFLKK